MFALWFYGIGAARWGAQTRCLLGVHRCRVWRIGDLRSLRKDVRSGFEAPYVQVSLVDNTSEVRYSGGVSELLKVHIHFQLLDEARNHVQDNISKTQVTNESARARQLKTRTSNNRIAFRSTSVTLVRALDSPILIL